MNPSRKTRRQIEKAKARHLKDQRKARQRYEKSKQKFSRRHLFRWIAGGSIAFGAIAGLSGRHANKVREPSSKPVSSQVQSVAEPNRPVEPNKLAKPNRLAAKAVAEPNRLSNPNKPVEKKLLRVKRPFAEIRADDFLLFRQEQAKRFGVEFTAKAMDKEGEFKPSASLMRLVKSVISEKCKALRANRIMVYSIIFHESRFNPNAKSFKDARGLGQLRDIQIKQLKKLGFTVSNPYDIEQSVEGCVRSVNWMWANLKVNGSRKKFLNLTREKQLNMLFTAYNGGLSRSNERGPNYKSGYSKDVFSIYQQNLKRNPFK